jgi:chorismate mutase/prephenate dehydratase
MARLDARLVATLDERARAARRLGEVRRDHAPAMPVTDHAAIQALVEQSSGDMPRDALREVLREVFAAGLALELPVKVAFVGCEGGPGHAAAQGRFGAGKSNFVPAESSHEALEEVSRKRAEFAVVPFETSTEGPLQSTILALMNRDLRISEILDDAFDLHLMVRPSSLVDAREAGQDGARAAAAPPANVDKIYATASDHALCGRVLEGLAPRVSVVQVKSARMACQLAVEERGAGAVATERFGALFGLEVARRDVRDAESPRVRHAVVGSRPSGRTGNEATSFVFSVQDAPGSLLDVLRVFAERGIRLTKIQSHPGHHDDRAAWSYLFYVEAAGHFTDRPLVTAFEEIKRMTRLFKLLGSYPVG